MGRSGVGLDVAVLTALSLAFYLPIFLGLPFVKHPYAYGYWLPRLVMPSLVSFLILGLAFLERFTQSDRLKLRPIALGYASVLAATYLYIL